MREKCADERKVNEKRAGAGARGAGRGEGGGGGGCEGDGCACGGGKGDVTNGGKGGRGGGRAGKGAEKGEKRDMRGRRGEKVQISPARAPGADTPARSCPLTVGSGPVCVCSLWTPVTHTIYYMCGECGRTERVTPPHCVGLCSLSRFAGACVDVLSRLSRVSRPQAQHYTP